MSSHNLTTPGPPQERRRPAFGRLFGWAGRSPLQLGWTGRENTIYRAETCQSYL